MKRVLEEQEQEQEQIRHVRTCNARASALVLTLHHVQVP